MTQQNNLIELTMELGKISVSYYDPNHMAEPVLIYDHTDYNNYAIPPSSYFDVDQLYNSYLNLSNRDEDTESNLFYRYLTEDLSVHEDYTVRILVPMEALDQYGTIRNCYRSYYNAITYTAMDTWKIAGSCALTPVSYTHLDVYKRQEDDNSPTQWVYCSVVHTLGNTKQQNTASHCCGLAVYGSISGSAKK